MGLDKLKQYQLLHTKCFSGPEQYVVHFSADVQDQNTVQMVTKYFSASCSQQILGVEDQKHSV